ncbi:probable RNA-directed DNA polymerase from transposon BS [Amyelois transitella]|uniref:probable RNA-directed DNA polymerase from transposon BS n=1 Tax=Amyelois transitella TaxID=680683 RepID=UPI00298F9CC0|nr:probable RNA-directed DNA polymerase from transposon BS [Amyelois transitella]
MDYSNPSISINILQWNCQSVRPKRIELEALLSQEKIHIAILSETWLEPYSPFDITGYHIFRADRHDGFGGVAILTHKSIKAQRFDVQLRNNAIEVIFVKIHNCDYIENVISVYCPPSTNTTLSDWNEVLKLGEMRSIVAGDFNAHHTNWSTKIDTRGGQIYDSIIENDYCSLNNGTNTRVKLVNGLVQRSSPDISLISTDIALGFDWQVLNENLGSDHLAIKLRTNISANPNYKKKFNLKKANWIKYKENIESLFLNFNLPQDNQTAYDEFTNMVLIAAKESIPYIKICNNPVRAQNFKPKPYWNKEVSKAVAERRRALAIFRRNPTPDNLELLQTKIRTAQSVIRSNKCKSWRGWCDSLDGVSSSTEMWNKMRWLKGYSAPTRYVSSDVADKLLCDLAPDFVTPPPPKFHSKNQLLSSPITLQELTNNLKQSDTAPGLDDISYSMINHLPDIAKSILVCLYNRFLNTGFAPSQWKEIKIVPIPKSGADSSGSSSGMRPIALISCTCKIFHSIITRRLEWYFEKNKLFSDETIGFRRTRSCMDNLSRLVSRIQIGFSEGLVTVGCFIDINNAYNNVDISCLVLSLDKIGVGASVCNYLWQFLSGRSLFIELDNNKIIRTTGTGIAQGDPLSPFLFNAATLSICKELSGLLFVSQYADDFVLYATHKDISEAVSIVQRALDMFNDMIDDIGLSVSHRKTKMCIFSRGQRKRLSADDTALRVKEFKIEIVDSVKYLGMWFDRGLKWGKHINYTYEKTCKFLNIFKVLAGSKWGIHPKHLRRLYIAIIRSRLDYGSFLYDTSVKSHLYKLDKVQNQAMRVIGGFIRTSPVHVMESELCLPPLSIRRRFLAIKFWFKSISLNKNSILEIIDELNCLCEWRYWSRKRLPLLVDTYRKYKYNKLQSFDNLPMYNLEYWVTYYDLSKNIIVSIDGFEKAKRQVSALELSNTCCEYLNRHYNSYYKLYTDGSKNKMGCGAAFYDSNMITSVKFSISGDISIMHAELIAISEALQYAITLQSTLIVIFTDSKSALLHLARIPSNSRGCPIAYTILETMNKLRHLDKNVLLQWIPSHIGIRGNEEADLAAKQAISEGISYECKPLQNEALNLSKVDCRRLWHEYFNERSRYKGIWYKTIQCQPPLYPWFDDHHGNRVTIVTLLRLRCGHIPSNKFKYLMGISDTPDCPECNKVDDVQHVLMECVRNEALRRELRLSGGNAVGRCNSLLADPLSECAKCLVKLCHEIII